LHDRGKETAFSSCVTRYTILFDFEYDSVGITVKEYVFYFLGMVRTFTFFPDALLASAEVVCKACFKCESVGFFIHVGKHKDFVGFSILSDGRDEGIFVPVYVHNGFSNKRNLVPSLLRWNAYINLILYKFE
jgi:hypothetical protein